MTSEILEELKENLFEMEKLMDKQLFTIKDAKKYLERYFNIYRKMEDLIASRNNWKKKYMELKQEMKNDKKESEAAKRAKQALQRLRSRN